MSHTIAPPSCSTVSRFTFTRLPCFELPSQEYFTRGSNLENWASHLSTSMKPQCSKMIVTYLSSTSTCASLRERETQKQLFALQLECTVMLISPECAKVFKWLLLLLPRTWLPKQLRIMTMRFSFHVEPLSLLRLLFFNDRLPEILSRTSSWSSNSYSTLVHSESSSSLNIFTHILAWSPSL